MNVLLKFRERIAALSHPLLLELEQLLTVIRTTFRKEHADDGTHTTLTATAATVRSTSTSPGTISLLLATSAANGTLHDVAQVNVGADTTLGPLLFRTSLYPSATGSARYVSLRAADSVDNRALCLNPTGGNVGVGTTSPQSRLDVEAGAVQFTEMTAPSNGAANTGRLFCRDNGAGKTQLCVIFGSGAVQVVATEP